MASRSAGMKCGFWAGGLWSRRLPAGCLQGSRRPGAAALAVRSPPETSPRCLRFLLITLEEALRAEKDHLALEHLFLHRVSPFPNSAELVVACFGNAETGAHT